MGPTISLALALAAGTVTEPAATIGDQHVGLDVDLVALSASTADPSVPALRLGSATVRIGVAERAELVVSPPGLSAEVLTGGQALAGAASARLKVTALASDDGAWGLAVQPFVVVPFSSGTLPAVGLAAPISTPLPVGLALHLMPAVRLDAAGAPEVPVSAALSWSVLPGITAYGEAGFAAAPLAFQSSRWLATSGVSFSVHPAVAFDAGLSAHSADVVLERGVEGTGFVGMALRM